MITILEGVDGSGKSSHAAWLAKEQNAKILHAGIPTHSHWFDEYIKPITDLGEDQNLILDRWHMGEMIWPTIFDRPSLFKRIESFKLCNSMLDELGAKIILVYRGIDAISTTLMLRGEQDQLEGVLKAQDMFIDLADRMHNVEIINSNELGRDLPDVS
jgi:adenosyl cobinamide kinase/adenosyl cobinamide phosphate guanylyltransferase